MSLFFSITGPFVLRGSLMDTGRLITEGVFYRGRLAILDTVYTNFPLPRNVYTKCISQISDPLLRPTIPARDSR